MIVGPVAFGEKAPTPQEMEKDSKEFYEKILPRLDKLLTDREFICGDDPAIVDIQYYNEIKTILSLQKKTLDPSKYPNLSRWFTEKMSRIPEIMEVDKKLQETISRYSF